MYFFSEIKSINAQNTNLTLICPWDQFIKCSDKTKMYRTFDGSCNNLKEPLYGRAETPFQRILKEAAYNKFNGMYLFMNNIHFMISMVYIYWIKKYNKWWMSKWHLNPQNVGFWA